MVLAAIRVGYLSSYALEPKVKKLQLREVYLMTAFPSSYLLSPHATTHRSKSRPNE